MRTAKADVGNREGLAPVESPDRSVDRLQQPRPLDDACLLSIEKLGRSFADHEVIKSLSLAVEAGQRVALRGANGSGKTTVLRCVAGTVAPSRGRISVGGHDAGTLAARRLLGASLSQERSFYLRLSGHMNLVCFARLRCESEDEAAEQVRALERELEIAPFASRPTSTYSAGMLQQLAFARALLRDPALLLLDEPTRSLDDAATDRFWHALDRRPHAAVLLATHDRDDLARCDFHVGLPS